MRTLEDTALAFDRAVRRCKARYAVVGAFASSTWGQPRTTADVDVLLHLPSESAAVELATALVAEGLAVSAQDIADAWREGGHATFFDEETTFHVDAKLARKASEIEQIDAAVEIPFHGATLRIARAEDTIAYKLLFGSEQDIKDVRAILVRQRGRLDEARLGRLAAELGVTKALERERQETEKMEGEGHR